jgi:adenosylcobyric acid synthase
MSAQSIMVLGCTSGAGKSWITTALCRWYARQGLRVAPFKAQNMSNHARVVVSPGGELGEIGSAQYFQALAAGVEPEVRFNPILLKPEADTRSQVVVLGQVRSELHHVPWRERSELLWAFARQAYESLVEEYDLILIEGAGSPAEINLASSDFVNIKTALLAQAACLLVSDIDRGGSFAHLYGTHQLMSPEVRRLVRGFVLNRFRGDAGLLAPGPEMLESLTGVPTLGVVPMVYEHGLPEEDAVPHSSVQPGALSIVVLAAPHASNLDELEPLRRAGAHLCFARDCLAAESADLLILPGSKQARADLAWLRERGLDLAIERHVRAGRPLLAICGGLQLAGLTLHDPQGVEGREGTSSAGEPGLGLLPITTRYTSTKRLARVRARLGGLSGYWARLSHLSVTGYEIHLGESTLSPDHLPHHPPATEALHSEGADSYALGWQAGSVLGIYLHGLLENPAVVEALLGSEQTAGSARAGAASSQPAATHPAVYDQLADVVDRSFRPGSLLALLEQC